MKKQEIMTMSRKLFINSFILFLALISVSTTNASGPHNCLDLMMPILNRSALQTPSVDSNLTTYSSQFIAKKSADNISNLIAELGQLTSDELKIKNAVLDLEPILEHRTSVDAIPYIIQSNGLLSVEKRNEHAITQVRKQYVAQDEETIYGAHRFVYFSVTMSSYQGDVRYGKTILQISKDLPVAQNVWGSRRSSWFYTREAYRHLGIPIKEDNAPEKVIELARELFNREIFVWRDFPVYFALEAIKKFRSLSFNEKETFLLLVKNGAIRDALNKYELGYLEGKTKDRINLEFMNL